MNFSYTADHLIYFFKLCCHR